MEKVETFDKAKGTKLLFKGLANKPEKLAAIKRVLMFDLYNEIVDNDLVAYYDEDGHLDELYYLERNYAQLLLSIVTKKRRVILNDVLPAKLPKFDNKSWREIYDYLTRSSEQSERNSNYSQGGGIYEYTLSTRELTTNYAI